MKKILIADDSSYQRKVLGSLVSELGYEYDAVSSGEELLDKLDASYDCVFLDLLMSGMSGVEVLRKLKERSNQTPVVVITADIQKKRVDECFELGASAFIEKVTSKEELDGALKEIFN